MKETYGLLLPILLPILGGFVCRLTVAAGEKKENKALIRCGEVTFLGLCFVTLILTVVFGIGPIQNGGHVLLSIPEICGRGIYFRVDEFRALYGILAAFCWTVSAAFALWYMKGEENRGRYFFYTLLTLGATLGVFYAAEFYTLFIFFEVMSLASYLWVVHEEDAEAVRASKTYLAVAVIGGLVMLMGIFLLESNLGTLNLQDIAKLDLSLFNQKELRIAGFCLLFGFGAKAGAFPLHIWLPKAHPVAPAPASALLSGILTKAGMYGILILTGRVFVGDTHFGLLLVAIAVCTMLIGSVGALVSVDMKHILACSSVSQIGFMLVGAGTMCILDREQWLAVQGTMLHMANHSLFKLVLFLCAGIVVRNLHTRDLNKLRGFGVGRPWFMVIFLIAALGISGVPGLSGFVSKSMLHESIVLCYRDSGLIYYKIAEILFLVHACLHAEAVSDPVLSETIKGSGSVQSDEESLPAAFLKDSPEHPRSGHLPCRYASGIPDVPAFGASGQANGIHARRRNVPHIYRGKCEGSRHLLHDRTAALVVRRKETDRKTCIEERNGLHKPVPGEAGP